MEEELTVPEWHNVMLFCKEKITVNNHAYWKFAAPLINQNIIEDAFIKQYDFMSLIDDFTIQIYGRTAPKNLERVKQKMEMVRPGRYFKSIWDTMAFRIVVNDIKRMDDAIKVIKQVCETNNGMFYISSQNPDDIVAFGYGYIPDLGHIMEFQFGHEFAFYTFARDSYMRSNPDNEMIDLWKNCFYTNTKKKILDQGYNFSPMDEIKKLYGDKPIEPELVDILSKL